jgi:hypothetical protein
LQTNAQLEAVDSPRQYRDAILTQSGNEWYYNLIEPLFFRKYGTGAPGGGGYFADKDEKILTGEVVIWDLDTAAIKSRLSRDIAAGAVHARFSPDGELVAGQQSGRTIQGRTESFVVSDVTLWEVASGDELWTASDGFAPDPQPPIFSLDSMSIYTRDQVGVRKLNVADGEIFKVLLETRKNSEQK